MRQVMNNMVCCERVLVRTPTGPGGISGPARLGLILRRPCSRRAHLSLHWHLSGRHAVPCVSAPAQRADSVCWLVAFHFSMMGVILAVLAHASANWVHQDIERRTSLGGWSSALRAMHMPSY